MVAENPQLNFDSRRHGNVEDRAILCEPCVCPSSVVADSRRRATVNDPNRLLQISHRTPAEHSAPSGVHYQLIETYSVDRLNQILTTELKAFSDYPVSYPPARYRVRLYRVT